MRELSTAEAESVNGGNAFFALAGAFTTGERIGQAVNSFNRRYSGISLGQAIYMSLH